MISFTAAYLLRLAAWGLVLGAFLGGLVWMSWRWWDRTLAAASAHARHRVACGHLLALLILPLTALGGVHLSLAAMGAQIVRAPPSRHVLSAAADQAVEPLALMTVTIWLAGALLAAFRLGTDAWQLRRLRTQPAPAWLAGEVQFLVARLRGNGSPPAVRIADAAGPQVTGVIHPVLVVPAVFLLLPAAEREAVLLHELAHVAQADFAANLLQRLLLAACWFQPAARALYHAVCREREARCDQLALEHGASALALARALVRLAEERIPPPAAMAATGRGDLGWRVQRLVTPTHPGAAARFQGWRAAWPATLALILCGFGGTRLPVADVAVTDLYIASALGPTVSVRAHDPGGVFGLQIQRGQVLEASVEDRPLPPANIRQHGDRVTLLGAANEPVVSLRVTPFGRIEWQPRAARTPGS